MGKFLIGVTITVGVALLFGCGHARSTVPQFPQSSEKLEARHPHASTYVVLYSFTGGADGANPHAAVIRDAAGDLYGTTYTGGSSRVGVGVVFKLDASNNETVLHSFGTGSTDGILPESGVRRDAAGNLYGSTDAGGSTQGPNCPGGCGTLFKVDPNNNEVVIHSFSGRDGNDPQGLIRDTAGDLYGVTRFAGGGQGQAFELHSNGTYTVLHMFRKKNDGFYPRGSLLRDVAGNLYGTTEAGGVGCFGGCGVVFKLDPHGNETVLHRFNDADGSTPNGGLIRDAAGNLYGTTVFGGTSGEGVVFKLDRSGNETVLHSFNASGGADGGVPAAGLVRDPAGNLYGTTSRGGSSNGGVVFRLDPSNNETILHNFSGPDGSSPVAGLLRDAAGNLYGTTGTGGSSNCQAGCGVVFKLTP